MVGVGVGVQGCRWGCGWPVFEEKKKMCGLFRPLIISWNLENFRSLVHNAGGGTEPAAMITIILVVAMEAIFNLISKRLATQSNLLACQQVGFA